MKRNLDGVYFRIKQEDGSWGNVCFSDLAEWQREDVMKDKSTEWLKSLCNILANTIREIGDQFDLVCGGEND